MTQESVSRRTILIDIPNLTLLPKRNQQFFFRKFAKGYSCSRLIFLFVLQILLCQIILFLAILYMSQKKNI